MYTKILYRLDTLKGDAKFYCGVSPNNIVEHQIRRFDTGALTTPMDLKHATRMSQGEGEHLLNYN